VTHRSLSLTLRLVTVTLATVLAAAPALAQPRASDAQRREARDLFKAGMQALLSERYDEAEQHFRGAVKLDPLFDAAFYGLGQVYMATKRYERALRAYQDSRAAFTAAMGEGLLDSTQAERAVQDRIQALQDTLRSYERMAPAAQNPGAINQVDRIREEIRQLQSRRGRKADAPLPIPAGLSMAIGSAHFRLNQLADAEREYRAAIETDPKFGEAHNNLAVVYMMMNRLDEADEQVKLAEKNGFKVNPQLKEDLKRKRGTK
jgi:tetratricopeptide (TPR) repeat protein